MPAFVALALPLLFPAESTAQPPQSAPAAIASYLEQQGRPGGFAVVGGEGASQAARALGATGRWLVRAAAQDNAQQQAWSRELADLHPLVTVRLAAGPQPFADRTVNAIYRGAGSPVTTAEATRLLAPEGMQWADGAWSRAPAEPSHAPWTHWLADAHGSGVSADTAVAPSNGLRWWSQRVIGGQIRSAAGVVTVLEECQADRDANGSGVQALDAYSGVPLWYREQASINRVGGVKGAAVAHPLGLIHAVFKEGSHAVLSDLRTGEVRVTYDQGLVMTQPWKERTGSPHLAVWKETLIQAIGPDIAALEVATGKRRWQVKLAGGITKLIISRDGTRIFLQEGASPTDSYGRWGSFKTAALTCVALDTGKTLWRHDWSNHESIVKGKRVVGPPNLSELIELNGVLYAWDHTSNIGSDHHGDLFAIQVATGDIVWHLEDANGKNPGDKEYAKEGAFSNNLVAWNGGLWSKIGCYATDKPALLKGTARFMGGNQRCVRLSGGAHYLVYGFTSFLDREGRSYQTGLIRGNCAAPNYATYGAVISVADETCSCYNGLRGQAALVPMAALNPVPDAARRTVPAPPPVGPPGALPDGPVTGDWVPWPSLRFLKDHKKLAGTAAGLDLEVDVQRHLVTARKGAATLWTHRADGRVFSLPAGGSGKLYIASAGGTVTCVNAADGAIQWRFLAAPQEAELVVNGQLESRWPIWNTLLHDGALYIGAGRHAEVDGGVWLWALDPATGAIRQRARIFLPITELPPGEESGPRDWRRFRGERDIASNSLLFNGLVLDAEGKVAAVNRKWNKTGSRPAATGYWRNLFERTQVRADSGKADLEAPFVATLAIDLAAWDGRTLDPITAFGQSKGAKFPWKPIAP